MVTDEEFKQFYLESIKQIDTIMTQFNFKYSLFVVEILDAWLQMCKSLRKKGKPLSHAEPMLSQAYKQAEYEQKQGVGLYESDLSFAIGTESNVVLANIYSRWAPLLDKLNEKHKREREAPPHEQD
ncbi:hypothetical protein [Loigolactobacillus backii]|uniref:hypothetical protein n=1 Tax=Loigolactobacillus backii TaxID=375175 RepID=UPI0007F0DCEE|nr:hypothetical protein [Loigolactobacillus backii]ANK59843.1 hypothetical protein AYR52_05955 [Loigolactobacillus backii]